MPDRPKATRKRSAIIVAGAITALLALAWFDGGEEPIRPIAQSISVPAGATGVGR